MICQYIVLYNIDVSLFAGMNLGGKLHTSYDPSLLFSFSFLKFIYADFILYIKNYCFAMY